MYRRIKATKDTYITNKIIRNSFRATDANVGEAASLDVFKLYAENAISGETNPIELSRLLIKFDLDELRSLTGSILDITSPSFKCSLNLYDVYGGQTLPSNFKLIAFPLSKSFDEGVGRDVQKFQDIDSSNFLTASISGYSAVTWFASGANKQGLLGADDIDIIASGNLNDDNGVVNLFAEQTFANGSENMSVDVTTVISGVLAGQIPDHGFRISFSGTQETDEVTRFVKRFGSRHGSDPSKHPSLVVKFSDTIQDHTEAFFFNLSGSVFLNNFERGSYANLVSGSALSRIEGSNSLVYRLKTGSFSKIITASQHTVGTQFVTGVYSASFAIDSFNTTVITQSVTVADFVRDSGSINFDAFWESLDGTVGFLTSSLKIKTLPATSFDNDETRYITNITNIKESYHQGRKVRARFVIFDVEEKVKAIKVPLYRASDILTSCHYRIRDANSDDVLVPFDTTDNSTLMSTDSQGMYFDFFTQDLDLGRTYTFDVLIIDKGIQQVFKNVSGKFRIE